MNEFTLPNKCGYCGVKLSDTEEVHLSDLKLYHPKCFKKLMRERNKVDLYIRK